MGVDIGMNIDDFFGTLDTFFEKNSGRGDNSRGNVCGNMPEMTRLIPFWFLHWPRPRRKKIMQPIFPSAMR